MIPLSDQEWDFRCRRYEQLKAQVSDGLAAGMEETLKTREPDRAEVERIINDFRGGGSVEELRSELDRWSRGARYWGFAGPNGAMFLNQLTNDSDTATITSFLRRAVEPPGSDEIAADLMAELEGHVKARPPCIGRRSTPPPIAEPARRQ